VRSLLHLEVRLLLVVAPLAKRTRLQNGVDGLHQLVEWDAAALTQANLLEWDAAALTQANLLEVVVEGIGEDFVLLLIDEVVNRVDVFG